MYSHHTQYGEDEYMYSHHTQYGEDVYMYCIVTIHSMGRTSTCTVYSPYNYTAVRCCIHAYVHMYMWHLLVQICTYVIAYVMLCARACTQYWNGALHNYIGTLCVHMHIRTYLRTYVRMQQEYCIAVFTQLHITTYSEHKLTCKSKTVSTHYTKYKHCLHRLRLSLALETPPSLVAVRKTLQLLPSCAALNL